MCPGSHDEHPVVVLRTNRSTYSAVKCNHDGHSVVILPCGLKAIPVMETTRDVREQRVALYTALVAYLEKLFLEKDRTHYASRRWWRAILIGYPKISAAVLLLFTIYFMLRKNPEYDSDVLRILLTLPVGYITFMILMGNIVFEKKSTRRGRLRMLHSILEPTFCIALLSLLT